MCLFQPLELLSLLVTLEEDLNVKLEFLNTFFYRRGGGGPFNPIKLFKIAFRMIATTLKLLYKFLSLLLTLDNINVPFVCLDEYSHFT